MATGLDKITGKILAEAKQEEMRILDQAEKEAKGLMAEAETSANSRAEKIKRHYEEMASGIKERVEASARLNAKMRQLRAENRAIEIAFEKAGEKLAQFKKSPKYLQFLEQEIFFSLQGEEAGPAELVVSEEDRKLFKEQVLQDIKKKANMEVLLSKDGREISGGVIVKIPGKGIEINRSFEAKLALCREKKMVDIAKAVYPEGGTDD